MGGHCIGIDPYYFTYQAEKFGYHCPVILAGRQINDSMGPYVAEAAIRNMVQVGKSPKNSKVVILGLTFKEDCPDVRNSKINDIIVRLKEYGVEPIVVDGWCAPEDAMHEYGVKLTPYSEIHDADCVIVAVGHSEFRALTVDELKALFRKDIPDSEKVLLDVKSLYPMADLKASGMRFWRL